MTGKKYDYLLVGSGLFSAVFACMARRHKKSCLVLEKRDHIGGNVYCEESGRNPGSQIRRPYFPHHQTGRYGSLSASLTEFNRYTNSPVANYKGEMYNLPFNMNTFSKMWEYLHSGPGQGNYRGAESCD